MTLDVDALYHQHGAQIRAYLGRRCSDEHLADDLAQDVWLRAVQHADRYVDTGAPPEAWLYRIARNLLTDHYRRRARVAIVRLGDLKPYVTHVGTDQHVERVAVFAAVGSLMLKQRAVIVGRFLEGRRHDEMGHLSTVNGSKKLQDRALMNLRRMLEAA